MKENFTVTIRDRSPGGKDVHEIALTFGVDRVKLCDIIAERVRMEIDLYEQKVAISFAKCLVQPTDAEARLNGIASKRSVRPIDAEKQIATAFHAFERNGFFVLVGDQQVTDLDEPVSLHGTLEISFIKLTPLVGG